MTGALLLSLLLWGQPGEPGATPSSNERALPPASTGFEATPLLSPRAAEADARARADLAAELGRILDGVRWPSDRWSVLAVSLDRGDTLFARDAHAPLTPASNVKLLTTAAALHHLGPDFRFQTFVLAAGPVDAEGVLRGDLVLYGTGDPAISDRLYAGRTAVLDSLAGVLQARGIRRVEGDIVGDGSFFSDSMLPSGWARSDLNDWFAAPVSALSYNENVATLRVEPGSYPGARPVVHTIPEDAPLRFVNEATTVRTRAWPPLMADRPDPREPIRILGQMRVGGRDAWRIITVDDPVLFAADAFLKALAGRGLEVSGRARSLVPDEPSVLSGRTLWAPALRSESTPRILARHRSPPLGELVQILNKHSHNLYAELLLKAVGHVAGDEGTRAGGVRAVSRFMRDQAGVDPSLFHLEDGSGLSPDNRASASAFVRILEHAARQPWAGALWDALPEAGNRTELRRMYGTAAAGNLRAKTGTIEGVSALSGIVTSREGERILFSILSNGLPSTSTAKNVEDRIGAALAAFDRPFDPSMAPLGLPAG